MTMKTSKQAVDQATRAAKAAAVRATKPRRIPVPPQPLKGYGLAEDLAKAKEPPAK